MSNEETSVRFGLTFKRSTLGGVAALALAASPAYSLTLGEAEVLSGLNQKFQAEIDLGAISSDELGGLSVRIAPDADYQRANMETGGVERNFSFDIVGAGSDAAIQITSDKLISEPLVVFLLEARWQRGRLLREYAIFLDPVDPDEEQQFVPRVTQPEVEPVKLPEPKQVAEAPKQPSAAELERERMRAPVSNPTHPDALPELPYHYGPVKKGVTGIQVAAELAQGTILTPEQMLMALFEVNPIAFHGNVNGLDAGFMLRIPDAVDIASINNEVAAEEISRHNASWKRHVSNGGDNKVVVPPLSVAEAQQESAGSNDENVSEEPEDDWDDSESRESTDAETDVADSSTDTNEQDESDDQQVADNNVADEDDRLELVAPDTEADEANLADTGTSSNPEVAAAQAETAALRVENKKLREQLSETESLLLDIRALLVARSDELSDLKGRIARLEGGSEADGNGRMQVEVLPSSQADGRASDSASQDSSGAGAASGQNGQNPKQNEEGIATTKPKSPMPSSIDEASGANGSDGIVSTISKTFDSVVRTVISIGWLVLLPLILLLLIILLFLLRRRKKEDEPEVTAGSVDEIEPEDENDGEGESLEESDDVEVDGVPSSVYSAPGMEVSTGSIEDFGDDFADELADEEPQEVDELEVDDFDEFDDFSDELGDELDEIVAVADEPEEVEELVDIEVASETDAAPQADADEFDILLPAAGDDEDELDSIELDNIELESDFDDLEAVDSPEEVAPAEQQEDADDLLSFDESAYEAPEESAAPVEMDATDDDMDFDLGDFEIAEPEPVADVAADMPAVDVDIDEDFGLDGSGPEADVAIDAAAQIGVVDAVDEPIELDDASSLDDLVIDGAASDEAVEDIAVDSDFELDEALVGDVEDVAGDTPAAEAEVETVAESDADADIAAFAGGDQANTKLDLAKAYIEMGDNDEARSLLEEVIAETDGQTKAEAEAALAELG